MQKDSSQPNTPGFFRSTQNESKTLYRSAQNKIIAGVAGGIGEYFQIDPTIIRIIFIILTLFHGSGLLIYIIMWVILPPRSQLSTKNEDTLKENISEIKAKAKSFAHTLNFRESSSREDSRFWWAILIIVLGFFFLFRNFGIFDEFDLGKFWPVILIVLGLIFFLKR